MFVKLFSLVFQVWAIGALVKWGIQHEPPARPADTGGVVVVQQPSLPFTITTGDMPSSPMPSLPCSEDNFLSSAVPHTEPPTPPPIPGLFVLNEVEDDDDELVGSPSEPEPNPAPVEQDSLEPPQQQQCRADTELTEATIDYEPQQLQLEEVGQHLIKPLNKSRDDTVNEDEPPQNAEFRIEKQQQERPAWEQSVQWAMGSYGLVALTDWVLVDVLTPPLAQRFLADVSRLFGDDCSNAANADVVLFHGRLVVLALVFLACSLLITIFILATITVIVCYLVLVHTSSTPLLPPSSAPKTQDLPFSLIQKGLTPDGNDGGSEAINEKPTTKSKTEVLQLAATPASMPQSTPLPPSPLVATTSSDVMAAIATPTKLEAQQYSPEEERQTQLENLDTNTSDRERSKLDDTKLATQGIQERYPTPVKLTTTGATTSYLRFMQDTPPHKPRVDPATNPLFQTSPTKVRL